MKDSREAGVRIYQHFGNWPDRMALVLFGRRLPSVLEESAGYIS